MHSAKMVCVLLLSIFFITATASAEEHHIRDGFWGGIDAGAGYLSQSLDEGNEDGTSFFLGFKGGYVDHWYHRDGDTRRKDGCGLTVGGGYDFLLNENVALTPFATFSYGETGNWDYQAITMGLGLTLP